MAFDQPTRNRLARFVGEARALLTEEFTRQLQHEYGLDPVRGEVAELAKLTQLDDARRETARILRDTLAHYLAGQPTPTAKARQDALDRIVREQAFTVLNRLCALRMAEARGLLIESIAKGYQSKGFQLYARLAGTALGETGDGYRTYLFSLFDEFGVDLAVLFDRFSPQGRLFPRASTLLQLLAAINHPDLEPLWAEDETIGWIYQYFNSKEERKAMRDASQAPRNSRELAVRNQFFTPRYVVEFLTDNTLGRIWYEMCKGKTRLKEQCRYLVRRPLEIFLDDPDQFLPAECRPWVRRVRSGDFTDLPDDPTELELASISFAFDGYAVAEALGQPDLLAWARKQLDHYASDGQLPISALELWFLLFALQREWRIITGSGPASEDFLTHWRQIYCAWKSAMHVTGSDLSQQELLKQPVYIAHRPVKDPTAILMLDPACGSMHFGLYAFDLFETIYQEAWEQGWAPVINFPYRAEPTIDQATVQLDPQRNVISNYGGQPIPFANAYLVVASESDGGNGVAAHTPYIVEADTTFRVPFRYRVKLSEFDYQSALRDGVFDEATGEQLVRAVGCFTYTEIPSRYSPEAYAAFQRLVPRLIIEYNIHGIDIDPRAVQIAGLSLWLRAQKSWQAQGVKLQERPTIRKSNIVCAEPMPGDKALLEEFLQGLRDDRLESLIRRVLNVPENQRVRATPTMANTLCDLVRTVWEEMKLAGEAGSLLKIEEALTEAIAKGRAEWEEKMPLFRVETFRMTEEKPKVNFVTVIPGEDVDFWARSESLVLAALEEYASQTKEVMVYQRRLFADDAVRGFAFIDLCRKRYDVVLMNPPFGEAPKVIDPYLWKAYPLGYIDLYTAFIDRTCNLHNSKGYTGAITSRTALTLASFSNWRVTRLLDETTVGVCADLGFGVLDSAMVETAAFTLAKRNQNAELTFIDLDEVEDKEEELQKLSHCSYQNVYYVKPRELLLIPNASMAYFLEASLRSDFQNLPSISNFAEVLGGNATSDDERFIRCFWEVPANSILSGLNRKWRWISKGGEYSLFYISIHLVVDWRQDGHYLGEYMYRDRPRNGYLWGPKSWSAAHMGLPGVVWSLRSQKGVSFRALPRDCAMSGKSAIVTTRKTDADLALLAILNTERLAKLSRCLATFGSYEKGAISSLPVDMHDSREFALFSTIAFKATCSANSYSEVDPFFYTLLRHKKISVQFTIDSIRSDILRQTEIVLNVLSSVNSKYRNDGSAVPLWRVDSISKLAESIHVYDIISELVGYALGRWDISFPTGEKNMPELPDPFDPLPVCPPGMLQNTHGLPALSTDLDSNYPLRISWLGILVDEAGHNEDIEQRIREVLRIIWSDHADAIEQEACEILGVASLRAYFANPNRFFDDHLKRYSKSRRVAPIYWPLSTPSGSYTLWLYYHRLTDQTLYSCVNDFVEPKLKQVNDDVDTLRRRANRSRQEEKELARLSDLALELAAFRDELLRIARFWQPNLNDGVQITAAPLWRLFQHRAWQKRLKETWEALEAGDYDWAHLAYSIWPERVRAKCKTDKSLAIAHDLEHLYIEPVKPVKAKKGGRKPQVEVETMELFEDTTADEDRNE